MIKGVLKNGFRFKIDDNVGDDYEVLELINEVDEEPQKITKLVERILGVKQKNALKEHIRSESGKVTVEAMQNALTEMFNQAKALKN